MPAYGEENTYGYGEGANYQRYYAGLTHPFGGGRSAVFHANKVLKTNLFGYLFRQIQGRNR